MPKLTLHDDVIRSYSTCVVFHLTDRLVETSIGRGGDVPIAIVTLNNLALEVTLTRADANAVSECTTPYEVRCLVMSLLCLRLGSVAIYQLMADAVIETNGKHYQHGREAMAKELRQLLGIP
jgi:hypothetical protein